jgi:LysM repeat protein
VAQERDISLSRLFDFNDMTPEDVASKDELIFLQRKRKSGATEFHIVSPSETVYDIAQKEGIRLESLMGYNFLRTGQQPQVGEKLYLTSKAPSMPRLVSFQETLNPKNSDAIAFAQTGNDLNGQNGFILHTVQPKETVYAIAKKYAVNVEDVMRWNDLQSIGLKTGQQLRINKKSVNATN